MLPEEELRKARTASGGAVFDAINVHGQDDFKAQPRKPKPFKAKPRAYCDLHHTYWCPCVRQQIYEPPFTRADETRQATKDWNDGTNLRASRKRTE